MQRRTAAEQALLVQRYIEKHLTERITVRQIAHALGRNASYLNTCYRAQTGESITGYIRRRKIGAARRQLRETAQSPAEICAALGYFDQSHFIRAFKAETGMTPGAYRRRAVSEDMQEE
ncbi:MAG: helix-turn-helix transcriptional regulator [Clostridia bacterium]|nr:helix-turn-helix transcriptional regulator [Clostridia bacterium]